ncbi:MAG: GTP-binding DUF697 domain-containing protein [Gemmataceae bacterium]|nr:GTP-binding DUF697 domain-containing protein [Gemmataceae bacterium]MDW8241650.1 DUF697 domain-containing protein [Thermogemmata sp.]
MAGWRQAWERGRAVWTAARTVVRQLFRGSATRPPQWEAKLAAWRQQMPVPVFWLVGKTQSGKTSIIRHLTGATDAIIGEGYRPTTRTTRRFDFPADTPLLTFLDTRGLDEPEYDPQEDVTACTKLAHCVIATVKVTDLAQATVRQLLQLWKRQGTGCPVVLCLTCLHEADVRVPLPQPYPFRPYTAEEKPSWPTGLSPSLQQHLDAQLQQFAGLYDLVVPIDLTRPEDGFPVPNYGSDALRDALLHVLPEAYRQTLLRWETAREELRQLHQQEAIPVIVSSSVLAATIGALPIPFADLPLLLGLHLHMARQLAQIYGQTLRLDNYRELAGIFGVGLVTRQLTRQLTRLIPLVGSALGGSVAFASTYALGRALCYYFEAVKAGHVPDAATLRRLYEQQLAATEAALTHSMSMQKNTSNDKVK